MWGCLLRTSVSPHPPPPQSPPSRPRTLDPTIPSIPSVPNPQNPSAQSLPPCLLYPPMTPLPPKPCHSATYSTLKPSSTSSFSQAPGRGTDKPSTTIPKKSLPPIPQPTPSSPCYQLPTANKQTNKPDPDKGTSFITCIPHPPIENPTDPRANPTHPTTRVLGFQHEILQDTRSLGTGHMQHHYTAPRRRTKKRN